jgi:hypothetical protein
VKLGEKVEFAGEVQVPHGAGVIVSAEWDYDGSEKYADVDNSENGSVSGILRRTYVFDRPGTYFVALRAASQRESAIGTPYGKAFHLDRVRVVAA